MFTGSEPSSKKRKTETAEGMADNYPPTVVRIEHCQLNLCKSGDHISTDIFYSRKCNGYKLRLALRSTENMPTEAHRVTKPELQIAIVALPDNDRQLEWPLNGTANISFKKSQEGDEINGDPISVKFSIENPTWCAPASGPIRVPLTWTPVPEECIPGKATYTPPTLTGRYTHPAMNNSYIATSIPDTLYILVKKIIHRKK